MRDVTFPGGEQVPCLGQGTWQMGERTALRDAEIAALREGVDLGMTLIDTAEMYGDGKTEELVGEALHGIRERVFLVSKAYPQNASRARLASACEASLRRLATDRLDLYLLHWRGAVPLTETVEAMEALRDAGKIRFWGVSNLDEEDMVGLLDAGGGNCVTDQILYNLGRRGPELTLLPWLHSHDMSAMAYSPVEQGKLVNDRRLEAIAADLDLTASQLALAWTIRNSGVITIPKAGSVAHVRENRAAADVVLPPETLKSLDRLFPAPGRAGRLEML